MPRPVVHTSAVCWHTFWSVARDRYSRLSTLPLACSFLRTNNPLRCWNRPRSPWEVRRKHLKSSGTDVLALRSLVRKIYQAQLCGKNAGLMPFVCCMTVRPCEYFRGAFGALLQSFYRFWSQYAKYLSSRCRDPLACFRAPSSLPASYTTTRTF